MKHPRARTERMTKKSPAAPGEKPQPAKKQDEGNPGLMESLLGQRDQGGQGDAV